MPPTGLNPSQHEAVTTLSGPLLVLAGAGTGKTRVVTYRIAELIRHRIRPDRILAVTFTNKAAAEMQERAATLLGKKTKPRPEISTFHSLCVRILRRNATRLGYPATFAICDRGDQEGFARSALREIRVPEATLRPGDLLNFVSRWKMASVRPEQAASLAQTDKEHLAAAAYRRYQRALKAAGSVDFDDLLLCTEELFLDYPEVRRQEADRFDHLLVDEYQDTNGTQYHIVRALAERHRNLCVVGDDDQSIYGWRGAEVTHILQFSKDWPDAKVVWLETNYRSTHEIVAWANRLIAYNKVRHAKVLRATIAGEEPRISQFEDESIEAKTVVGEIQERIAAGQQPRDFAILFRTNEQPRAFEAELRRAKVPYVLVGGMSFYDRKEVRDILAYLKLLSNPCDEVSFLRVINTPARGIGQATVMKLLERAVGAGKPLWEVIQQPAELAAIPSVARQGIALFHRLIEKYGGRAQKELPVDVVRDLINEIHYREDLTRQYPDTTDQQNRWATVEEVVNAAANYGQRASEPTMGGFLQEVVLNGNDDDDKESQLQRNAVALMTLHAAKGLEFSEVYMVGMEEGVLPHHRSIEADGSAIDEERRLCYVGITRAQRRLTLSLALSRMKWGKPRPTMPSRFLYEVTGQATNPNYVATINTKGKVIDGSRRSKPRAAKSSMAKSQATSNATNKRPAAKNSAAKGPTAKSPTPKPGPRS
jgi:DNA helicase-2/ATP-dependent DNA helicase PcrA